ncbi:transposase, partial [Lampropedia puyangensis]
MKQTSLGSGFELSSKRTRKREFLEEMERVVPWAELVALVQFHQSVKGHGRPSFAIETMLRIHFLQQWFNLSDPAMEEALYDTPLFSHFAQLDAGMSRLP